MKIIIATSNEDKVREIKEICANISFTFITLKKWASENKIVLPEIVEDGKTFEDNSLIKAKAAFELTGLPSLADDSGLVISELNGEPGLFSARYAVNDKNGINLTQQEIYKRNREKVIKKMEGVAKRDAHFICSATLVLSSERILKSTGKCFGKISIQNSSEDGFGYDPIFLFGENGRLFSKITLKEKNQISHRGIALRNIFESLHLVNLYDKNQ